MKTWLLIDTTYLSHRARHSTGGLSYGGMGTGVAFGVLRDLEGLSDQFGSDRTILAFDSRHSLRKEIYPAYKSKRKEGLTEEQKADNEMFYEEVFRLQHTLLPMMGYKNIIEVKGYESDDILAKVALEIPDDVEAVIVSSDKDLLQCVTDRVVFHNPTTKKTTNRTSFVQEWGVHPEQWAQVKAIAGCSTDDVEGIKGIGEVTAAGWFNGKLKQGGKKWQAISDGIGILERNLPLVRLPYPGLELPQLVDDQVTADGKLEVQKLLGIRSGSESRRLRPQTEFKGFDL